MREKRLFPALRMLLAPALTVLLLLWLLAGTGKTEMGGEERRAQLEEALHQGAVSCYAQDGVYPPTLEELLRRSGVQVDESRYAVDYQIFAENLMPDITVLERGSGT